ncbi:hypothetical protein ACHAPJ_007393 [Fusarium lateritium]
MNNLERNVFVPLPPKEYMIHFVFNALDDMYQIRPLFSNSEVLKLVDDQCLAGLSNCHDNPTRWATLNALIAMGIQWKADNGAIEELFPISWAYLKNAYAIFPELVARGASIESCQAMLVMALFMQGTADALTFTSLLSAAAHAAQCIGLHLEDVGGPTEVIDMEKRRRTFWLIRVLQCNASIKLGLPAPFDEIDVDLPTQEPAMEACVTTDLLRHMSTLSLIQSRISRHLRPESALWKDHDEMLQVLADIDNRLAYWLSELPSEFRPPHSPRAVGPGIAELHFAYYACTWRIHAANSIIQKIQNRPASASSLLLIVPDPTHSARATISLLQSMSPQPLAVLWYVLRLPVPHIC